jgi:hypothetical protein
MLINRCDLAAGGPHEFWDSSEFAKLALIAYPVDGTDVPASVLQYDIAQICLRVGVRVGAFKVWRPSTAKSVHLDLTPISEHRPAP